MTAVPAPGSSAIDLGGTVRAAGVDTTLARASHVSKAIGISRVANVTGLDHVGVPTWVAVRPLARSLTVSQGKGMSHALARASAVMESIERHHAEHYVADGTVASIGSAMVDGDFVDPLQMPIHRDAAFRRDATTGWIEGRSVRSGASRWVPSECIRLDSVTPRRHPRLFVASSNGLASGNTTDEALLHALCEAIERDQVALWTARRAFAEAESTRLETGSIVEPNCRWLIDRCEAAGLHLVVWYVTRDVDVPCFKCTVFDPDGNTLYPQRASGFGCHPFRRIALARAITEALQSRLTFIAGARDDLTWADYRSQLRLDDVEGAAWSARLDAEREALPLSAISEAPPIDRVPQLAEWVVDALEVAGIAEPIVVDLTQDAFGIPVLHVTVPGLEGVFGSAYYTPGSRMQAVLQESSLMANER